MAKPSSAKHFSKNLITIFVRSHLNNSTGEKMPCEIYQAIQTGKIFLG